MLVDFFSQQYLCWTHLSNNSVIFPIVLYGFDMGHLAETKLWIWRYLRKMEVLCCILVLLQYSLYISLGPSLCFGCGMLCWDWFIAFRLIVFIWEVSDVIVEYGLLDLQRCLLETCCGELGLCSMWMSSLWNMVHSIYIFSLFWKFPSLRFKVSQHTKWHYFYSWISVFVL